MSYGYSSELKPPQKLPEIDPGKPAMAGMLKILAKTHQKQTAAFQPPAGLRVQTITIPSVEWGVPCFVVEPEDSAELLPGVLMLHGGAFYLPLQTSALSLACEYAKDLGARVFLPDYRLIPQHAAPAQLEDCLAVWLLLYGHGADYGVDPARMLLMGDSAGAALAAGICILCRNAELPLPRGQLLIYPVLDDRTERYASYEKYPDAAWSTASTRAMWAAYLKDAPPTLMHYLAPMRCEKLQGLPPTYIEPQEIDVLHDEAIAYAEALQKAGVPVTLREIAGSYHGFDGDLASPLVQRVIAERLQTAKQMLGGAES